MSPSLLSVSLLLSAVVGVFSQCEPEAVANCAERLKSLYNNQDGPVIVKSESELRTLCTHQRDALDCINNYVNRCLQEPHKNLFNNMTSGVQDFVKDFCKDDSMTRKVYVKHLGCFNKVSDDVHACTKRLHEWNKQVERRQHNRENTMRESCCRYDNTMGCIRDVVRHGCPDEAANLFDSMIDKVTKQFFQIANCANYNYVVSECSGASGVTSTLSSSILSLASLAFVLLSTFKKMW